MNYFENCKTVEELKQTYKKLALQYHPDVYGEKGNDIMKEIHKQLETATKNIDVNYRAYNNYVDLDTVETPETRAKKEEIAKRVFKQHGGFAYQYLFVEYLMNGLRPANHRNPLTKHNFSGWNIWELELQMLLKGYTSCEWSTFPQIKADENSVLKGEKGTQITLAIVYDKKDKDGNKTDDKGIYYKGYTVFNREQTAKGKEEAEPKQLTGEVQKVEKKEPQKIKLNYHIDPGHGWLATPIRYIKELKLEDKISACSYISKKKTTVYLEEDCDAGLLIEALKAKNIKIELKKIYNEKYSFIRYLKRYEKPINNKIIEQWEQQNLFKIA